MVVGDVAVVPGEEVGVDVVLEGQILHEHLLGLRVRAQLGRVEDHRPRHRWRACANPHKKR
jgi:hypothetical protein